MKRQSLDKLLYVLSAVLCAWLVLPGLGPDIMDLEQRFGWKVGPDNWRGPLSTPPSYTILDPEKQQLLSTVVIRNEHTSPPPYHRSEFGHPWADVDHNGCDTRNDILARDTTDTIFKPGTRNCVVVEGKLSEPYTGQTMNFIRGKETSALIQIDHVVALGDAWRSGAWAWSAQKREQFANDPQNLLAVDGQQNQDKGSANAAHWLPPNEAFQCAYVTRQLYVKAQWQLSMTPAERSTIERILSYCPPGADEDALLHPKRIAYSTQHSSKHPRAL
ncbi:HNH endonuclease family protein [Arcanobacterium buesumense]|uniref:HNH endonuclease n=1 Tax=Arcanobacterium buesumense TaxID=2722751 RepID=A0A6H2ELJ4_9ACTO|nr:HNH endonuclease family protein [Arcanobacterium buesumense]QJC21948.1 HNH endonuclease [Arcanobacterium buesumense]